MQQYEEPSTNLSPFIERYWWKKVSSQTPLLNIYPSTGAELIFHFNSPFTKQESSIISSTPTISLLYSRKSSVNLIAEENVSFVSIRFRTGMLHHFLNSEIPSNLPAIIDATELFGEDLYKCYEKLLLTKNHFKQKQIIEDFLFHQLNLNYQTNSKIDYLAKLLYYKSDELTVEETAKKIGYSRRQLLRKSNSYFGLTPKEYLSIARFNRVLKKLLFLNDSSYQLQALDGGYFDQAHFIHEFKKITKTTPKQFLINNNKMSHFYNTSLKTSSYIATTI